MILQIVLVLVGGYLLGSIPAAYVTGRWYKGLDLRRYGSGTVSGSMVFEHVARWAVVPVGLFDIGKAALPAWVALQLDLGLPVAAAAGMVAVVGHNWPIFLRFTGGRGLGSFMGVLLVVFPWGFAWLLGFLAAGWLLGDSAPWALASLVTMPIFAHLIDGPPLVTALAGSMVVITLLKRLEANRRPLPPTGPERRRIIMRRLLLDRDLSNHKEWLQRQPEAERDA
ncbi:MAG: glycerol-3-phosphate acyltransferase [Anaerolineae bacterium]|jgi:glycerol-3-phosphate acyltransferase PlsY